ncbi:MAG: hypothetical protein Q4P17_11485 [Methanobacterium sp.]|nr:hypothetical protein [Methanobacterium sp.]
MAQKTTILRIEQRLNCVFLSMDSFAFSGKNRIEKNRDTMPIADYGRSVPFCHGVIFSMPEGTTGLDVKNWNYLIRYGVVGHSGGYSDCRTPAYISRSLMYKHGMIKENS